MVRRRQRKTVTQSVIIQTTHDLNYNFNFKIRNSDHLQHKWFAFMFLLPNAVSLTGEGCTVGLKRLSLQGTPLENTLIQW